MGVRELEVVSEDTPAHHRCAAGWAMEDALADGNGLAALEQGFELLQRCGTSALIENSLFPYYDSRTDWF